jgi:hypothetical protein
MPRFFLAVTHHILQIHKNTTIVKNNWRFSGEAVYVDLEHPKASHGKIYPPVD